MLRCRNGLGSARESSHGSSAGQDEWPSIRMLGDPSAETDRVALVEAMGVFLKTFAYRHCARVLSHGRDSRSVRLNGAVYMMWDIAGYHGMPRGARQCLELDRVAVDTTALRVLGEILDSDHVALIESALHGLGHWHGAYPDEVHDLIERTVLTNQGLDPGLRAYARRAMRGEIE